MSEHSIEELERQYEQAVSRSYEADRKKHSAKDALMSAKRADLIAQVEAMGVVLGKTRVRLRTSPFTVRCGEFFVVGAENSRYGADVYVSLAKIKRDGTPSSAPSGQSHVTLSMIEVVQ